MATSSRHIVVVGGGFSGVALVLQLLAQDRLPLSITLVESGTRLGRGAAYSTEKECCLLNASAGRMSIYPHQPMHFVRWLNANRIEATPTSYARRLDFGNYVEDSLLAVFTEISGRHTLSCRLRTSVLDVSPTTAGFTVRLNDGEWLACDSVVLAAGYLPARNPLAPWITDAAERYLFDPRDEVRLGAIRADDSVLLVGTGLTMVDVMLILRAGGHKMPIQAISRRGLLPRGHQSTPRELPTMMATILGKSIEQGDLSQLLQTVRRLAAIAEKDGVGWQSVVDYVRDHAPRLWQSLAEVETSRFLRHLRPYWETHRHRMAPTVSQSVTSEYRDGGLRVRSASIAHASDHGSKLRVTLRPRGTTMTLVEHYDWIVRCTEPGLSGATESSVFERLLQRGLLKRDRLQLGLLSTPEGLALGDRGEVPGLYLLGPVRRATEWEQTAVPELRDTAATLALSIVSSLSSRNATSNPGFSSRIN